MLTARQKAFLAAFALTASITKAAKAVKLDRRNHYDWLDKPEYADAFTKAQDEAAQILEDEAVRRATEGVAEPVMYQGEFCYRTKVDPDTGARVPYGKPIVVKRYSDGLMMFLLRGMRPDKYRERSAMELTGKGGAPIDNNLQITFVRPE